MYSDDNFGSIGPAPEEWDARVEAWQARVAKLGAERAIYHSKHTAEEFPAVTEMQQAAIWPHFIGALTGQERRALDYGCGYGRWTPQLAAALGFARGVDPTPELLELARERLRADRGPGRVEYARLVRGQIPSTASSFDVIWACMVLSTVLTDGMFRATLAELRRVARPGGLVFIIDNTSRADGEPVRSKYSISRTIDEYVGAFRSWVELAPVGQYIDLGEINTVFRGRVRA
jgi:ubiquinone/menaquinone biosynthesis C-methylase UbiE